MIFAALITAALTCALTAAWWPAARALGLVAVPDARRRHRRPTVCVGAGAVGAVCIAGALCGVGNIGWIGAGAACAVGLGSLDDRLRLGAGVKLLGQIGAAALPVFGAGLGPALISIPGLGALDLGVARGPVWVAGIVVAMNVVNLIDGHDGLAAGLVGIGAGLIVILAGLDGRPEDALLGLCVAVACACFLCVNLPPARVFLGDQGSIGLGYLLAVAALCAAAKTGAALGVGGGALALLVPALDAFAVAAHRIRRRRAPWRADRTHVHHRLARAGAGPWAVLARAWGSAVLWGAYAAGLHLWGPAHRWGALGACAAALAVGLVSLHLLCLSRRPGRSLTAEHATR